VFTQLARGPITDAMMPAVVRVSPSMAVSGRVRKSRMGCSIVLFHLFGCARSMWVK